MGEIVRSGGGLSDTDEGYPSPFNTQPRDLFPGRLRQVRADHWQLKASSHQDLFDREVKLLSEEVRT